MLLGLYIPCWVDNFHTKVINFYVFNFYVAEICEWFMLTNIMINWGNDDNIKNIYFLKSCVDHYLQLCIHWKEKNILKYFVYNLHINELWSRFMKFMKWRSIFLVCKMHITKKILFESPIFRFCWINSLLAFFLQLKWIFLP